MSRYYSKAEHPSLGGQLRKFVPCVKALIILRSLAREPKARSTSNRLATIQTETLPKICLGGGVKPTVGRERSLKRRSIPRRRRYEPAKPLR